ncbi:hypothetical protein DFH11DRAFT_944862 [Phellopilus nigrolimitatus]|nr:hypothetical protein DFH11DRAFT_944862 [Phellopilus nigrolimitatus]
MTMCAAPYALRRGDTDVRSRAISRRMHARTYARAYNLKTHVLKMYARAYSIETQTQTSAMPRVAQTKTACCVRGSTVSSRANAFAARRLGVLEARARRRRRPRLAGVCDPPDTRKRCRRVLRQVLRRCGRVRAHDKARVYFFFLLSSFALPPFPFCPHSLFLVYTNKFVL